MIDLGVSAAGAREAGDASLEVAARRALREYCKVDIAPALWAAEAQSRFRSRLGVDVALKFWDCDTKVFVIILPEDVVSTSGADGVLRFEARAEGSAGSSKTAGKQDGGRSVGEWKSCQDEFKHLGNLPKPWIFV